MNSIGELAVKPNLFKFASSELSQDAMLCWLAHWGDPTSATHDLALHHLGQKFLQTVFKKHGRRMPEIVKSIEIKRQYRNIDVLLVINDAIAVCIVDKVGTTEHSEQLQRYLVGLKEDGFSEDQIIPVYVQTGEQGSYRGVRAAGYEVMRRRELIAPFLAYQEQGGSDSIARDFHDYLTDIEIQTEAFRTQPLSEWNWRAWQGFYSELQHQLGDGEWGYVANPSGGFIGYWWNWISGGESEKYLQIEQAKLCFKISVDDAAKRSEQQAFWLARFLRAASDRSLQVVKPNRIRTGQTMTIVVLDREYRVVDSRGLLDIAATGEVLRSAADVLNHAIAMESI